MDIHEVINFVIDADQDDLRIVSEAVKARSETLRRRRQLENLSSIAIGDSVRLVNVKPKYLNGTRGTVTGRKGEKFVVKLLTSDERALRRFGREATCPASIVEKVEA